MAENDQKVSEFSNLRIRYFTGQTYLASERNGQKVRNYRSYAFTKLGAIPLPEWLLIWKREHNYGKLSETQLELSALDAHISRIFDNGLWCDWVSFNRKFRPEELGKTELISIKTPCCSGIGEVTKEQLDFALHRDHVISCPFCGRFTDFKVCTESEFQKGVTEHEPS